ncbi:hypothetical protein ACFOGJ_09030 [Marinibaculum pumilum]|uniref:TubC N-terminal docking domain-containing protein n=1 Tax=Marinibaculum pumilum TaxID=1766165 RepID=A0ABV7KY88_9PROT
MSETNLQGLVLAIRKEFGRDRQILHYSFTGRQRLNEIMDKALLADAAQRTDTTAVEPALPTPTETAARIEQALATLQAHDAHTRGVIVGVLIAAGWRPPTDTDAPAPAKRPQGFPELLPDFKAEADRPDEVVALRAQVEGLAAACEAWLAIVGDSQGIYGMHLNGDPSPWSEFESEISATEAALTAIGRRADAKG